MMSRLNSMPVAPAALAVEPNPCDVPEPPTMEELMGAQIEVAPIKAVPGKLIEVIPGRLMWAPEAEGEASALRECTPLSAFQLAGVRSSEELYTVPHYSNLAYGRAFGPVALDKTMEFCGNLFRALGDAIAACPPGGRCACLAVTTSRGDIHARTNVAAMLGAYLVLRHQWTAKKVRQVLGSKDADLRFSCSWSRPNKPEGERILSVYHVWEGMQVGRELEWINPTFISDPMLQEAFCVHYKLWSLVYDGTWIVPGRIVVMADPGTTMSDPNPTTFKRIFPEDAKCDGDSDGIPESPSPSRASTKCSMRSTASHVSSFIADDASTDTICKDFTQMERLTSVNNAANGNSASLVGGHEATDLVTYLKQHGVNMMIRCNYADEPGMPIVGYDAEALKTHGIGHRDIVVPDFGGGLPTKAGVRHALELARKICSSSDDAAAVAVHCKGGFGRSIVLACCLAIYHFDIPGDAMMGWVRVARPGAITTPIQERFLQQMTGRKALHQWAEMQAMECDDQPTCPGGGAGCSVM